MEKEGISVKLNKDEREIVKEYARTNSESFSWALRSIIREWARSNPGSRIIVTGGPVGRVDDA